MIKSKLFTCLYVGNSIEEFQAKQIGKTLEFGSCTRVMASPEKKMKTSKGLLEFKHKMTVHAREQ